VTGRSYSKHDIEQLRAVLKYCIDIEDFVLRYGSDEEDFNENLSFQYSCVFALIRIGEHVIRLSPEFKNRHPDISWKDVIGMKDIMVHNYTAIIIPKLRSVILSDVPVLRKKCSSILERL